MLLGKISFEIGERFNGGRQKKGRVADRCQLPASFKQVDIYRVSSVDRQSSSVISSSPVKLRPSIFVWAVGFSWTPNPFRMSNWKAVRLCLAVKLVCLVSVLFLLYVLSQGWVTFWLTKSSGFMSFGSCNILSSQLATLNSRRWSHIFEGSKRFTRESANNYTIHNQ